MTTAVPAVASRLPAAVPLAAASVLAAGRRLVHPLTAICAAQAALSMTLVWSNTAAGDEADYLWVGHLVIRHWLHGTSWPLIAQENSGSPVIYPPLGAVADSIGGLAGARILSLAFMLAATVLLYLTASRVLGRTGALVAAGLWALTEPVLRLAFATFDPLSVSLTALAAWLAVEGGYRHRTWAWAAASGAVLALANATAFSGIVIDPVVVAFAFLMWLPRLGMRQAARLAAVQAAGCVAVFGLLMVATGSWAGTASVLRRHVANPNSELQVLDEVWKYSALIIVLAVTGAAVAIWAESRQRAALLVLLAGAVLVAPAAQLHYHTAASIDKHLAYGIWFAAMAAAYGCGQLINWLPGKGTKLAAFCCALAFVFPAVNSWESAWHVYHDWPDTRSFVTSFRPIVANSRGFIYAARQQAIAQYYTPQGSDWQRWDTHDILDPSTIRRSAWPAYYRATLRRKNYSLIALFYPTAFQTRELSASILLSPHQGQIYQQLLSLVASNYLGEPGLSPLTVAIEQDPSYRLVAVGPWDGGGTATGQSSGLYAIWRKVGPG
jgi:hypothetical protein